MAPEPTGTPDPATGTTAQAADGSAAPAGGSGEETPEQKRITELERIHEQDLARLSAGEAATRRAQDLESELERERQRNAYQPPTGANPQLEQFQRDYQDLASRDEAAARLISGIGAAAEARIAEAERKGAYRAEMDSVPQADREEVERRMKATPGLSPKWALKDLKAERLDSQQSALDARQKKLDEEEAARKKGRVDVTVTGIPGSDLRTGDMTLDRYQKLCDLAGERTPEGRKALQQLKAWDAANKPIPT